MSGYRDDRDALQARNAALEEALAAKEAEIARLKAPPAPAPPPLGARIPPMKPSPGVFVGASSFKATADVSEDMFAPSLMGPAWIACVVLGLVYAADIALGRVLHGAGSAVDPSTVWMALGGTAVIALIVVVMCGRPIAQLPGMTVDFMVTRIYMPWLFGLFLPFYPLLEGLIRIGSTSAGGYNTSNTNGLSNYQPVVMMKHGESRPVGVALLLMAALWPIAVWSLAGPWFHL